MNRVIWFPKAVCRYSFYEHCANHFWQTMKSGGKPALKAYFCLLWQEKLLRMEDYRQAVWRAGRFGLKGIDRERAVRRDIGRTGLKEFVCPDFRSDPDRFSSQCRFHYWQTCLLKFPKCPGRCDDYLPPGDQKSPS